MSGAAPLEAPREKPRRKVGRGLAPVTEFAVEALIRVLGFSTIGFVILIFLFLLREGVPVFFEVPMHGLFSTLWYPTFKLFGTLPLILGSVLVTIASVVIALPLGVATAVFVREVAPGWAREILKPVIEVLSPAFLPWCSDFSA